MSDDYNLLKHVFLSCETLLNIAQVDFDDEGVEQNFKKHQSHIADAPKDLIATIKWIANNGCFLFQDTIKLLENVNLSDHELFTLMCLALDDQFSDEEAIDNNKVISSVGSKHPKFDQHKYTELLLQLIDVFPVKVSREPLSPKHVLLRLIKDKTHNFSAMLSICHHPKTDTEMLAHLAKEFYFLHENRDIPNHTEENNSALQHHLKNSTPEVVVLAAILLADPEVQEDQVHLKLMELDNKTAKYWKDYFNVKAFDD